VTPVSPREAAGFASDQIFSVTKLASARARTGARALASALERRIYFFFGEYTEIV
jgi:hypothetical protein